MCVLPNDLCILLVLSFAVPPFAKHDRGIHIGWREGVGLIEKRDHTEQDSPSYGTTTHKTQRQRKGGNFNIRSRQKKSSTQAFWNASALHPGWDVGSNSPLSSIQLSYCTGYAQSAQVFKYRLSTFSLILEKMYLADMQNSKLPCSSVLFFWCNTEQRKYELLIYTVYSFAVWKLLIYAMLWFLN